jgi:flagellar motor switch protein FliG
MSISNSENENEIFLGLKKAAVVMVALDYEVSGQLFRYLPENDV